MGRRPGLLEVCPPSAPAQAMGVVPACRGQRRSRPVGDAVAERHAHLLAVPPLVPRLGVQVAHARHTLCCADIYWAAHGAHQKTVSRTRSDHCLPLPSTGTWFRGAALPGFCWRLAGITCSVSVSGLARQRGSSRSAWPRVPSAETRPHWHLPLSRGCGPRDDRGLCFFHTRNEASLGPGLREAWALELLVFRSPSLGRAAAAALDLGVALSDSGEAVSVTVFPVLPSSRWTGDRAACRMTTPSSKVRATSGRQRCD